MPSWYFHKIVSCHIPQHSSKFSNRIPVLLLFSLCLIFFPKRNLEMKSAQSSLLTRCHLIWSGLGQKVRDYENSMLTLAKELSLHHLTHCPKVNEISVIIALRFTFSTAYSLKSFLDTESFLNPHFSKSCSFPLTLAATPFATCWHHFNFFGAFFSI